MIRIRTALKSITVCLYILYRVRQKCENVFKFLNSQYGKIKLSISYYNKKNALIGEF